LRASRAWWGAGRPGDRRRLGGGERTTYRSKAPRTRPPAGSVSGVVHYVVHKRTPGSATKRGDSPCGAVAFTLVICRWSSACVTRCCFLFFKGRWAGGRGARWGSGAAFGGAARGRPSVQPRGFNRLCTAQREQGAPPRQPEIIPRRARGSERSGACRAAVRGGPRSRCRVVFRWRLCHDNNGGEEDQGDPRVKIQHRV